MRKPNWKRRGFASLKSMMKIAAFERKQRDRRAKLESLPPELRAELAKSPELERLL